MATENGPMRNRSERYSNELRRAAPAGIQQQPMPLDLVVGFDSADMCTGSGGYCHLLSAQQTHFWPTTKSLFQLTADAVFPDPQTEFAQRRNLDMTVEPGQSPIDYDEFDHLIAVVHLTNFEVREPARLKSSSRASLEDARPEPQELEADPRGDRQRSRVDPRPLAEERHSEFVVQSGASRRVAGFSERSGKRLLLGRNLLPFWRHGFKEG